MGTEKKLILSKEQFESLMTTQEQLDSLWDDSKDDAGINNTAYKDNCINLFNADISTVAMKYKWHNFFNPEYVLRDRYPFYKDQILKALDVDQLVIENFYKFLVSLVVRKDTIPDAILKKANYAITKAEETEPELKQNKQAYVTEAIRDMAIQMADRKQVEEDAKNPCTYAI